MRISNFSGSKKSQNTTNTNTQKPNNTTTEKEKNRKREKRETGFEASGEEPKQKRSGFIMNFHMHTVHTIPAVHSMIHILPLLSNTIYQSLHNLSWAIAIEVDGEVEVDQAMNNPGSNNTNNQQVQSTTKRLSKLFSHLLKLENNHKYNHNPNQNP